MVLLTGATGLLGGNLIRILSGRGERVRVLVLTNDPAIASLPDNIEVITGDLLDNGALDRFVAVAEDAPVTVIRAAGIVTMDPKPNRMVHAVNVDGTRAIVDRCVRNRVYRLVYVSSTGAIPEPPVGTPIREPERMQPDAVVGYYAQTKAEATALVMRAVREQGLNASIVYPSGIIGPNDLGAGLITSSLKMAAQGKLRVAVGGTVNLVDVRDLAQGILSCAQSGRKGEGYILGGALYTFADMLKTTCEAAGVKKPLFTIPVHLLRPFAGLGLLYSHLFRKPQWFSPFTIYNLTRNNDFRSDKAARELGFHSRPPEESIRDLVAWFVDQGMIRKPT